MNFLVTGAAGFIGSVLTERARDRGHKVIALDDFSRGLNKTDPIIKFDCMHGIGPILEEITNPADKVASIDVVVHLAAATGSLDRPLAELMESNLGMTQRVFEDARKWGIKLFVFPTTSLFFGAPNAPYVVSKEAAMNWLLQQPQNHNTPKILPFRFFNVTGAHKMHTENRKKEVHIIPEMVKCHLEDRSFIINGSDYETSDGTPGRDYTNVNDVTDFILFLSARMLTGSFPITQPIQVGTGKSATTLQMLGYFNEILSRLGKKPIEWKMGPRRAYDCGDLHPTEPHLWLYKKPIGIKQSLHDEIEALFDLHRAGRLWK